MAQWVYCCHICKVHIHSEILFLQLAIPQKQSTAAICKRHHVPSPVPAPVGVSGAQSRQAPGCNGPSAITFINRPASNVLSSPSNFVSWGGGSQSRPRGRGRPDPESLSSPTVLAPLPLHQLSFASSLHLVPGIWGMSSSSSISLVGSPFQAAVYQVLLVLAGFTSTHCRPWDTGSCVQPWPAPGLVFCCGLPAQRLPL